MTLWMVRAGRRGEQEQFAIDNNLITIGWNVIPSLAAVSDRDALAEIYRQNRPDASAGKVANHVGQLWSFRSRIELGDLVALPLKTQSAIAIGRVTGPYEYRTNLGETVHHVRSVEWLATDIPRTAFDQDLLYSFGAFMTVCRIRRNNAEDRIRAILSGRHDPGTTDEAENEAADSPPSSLDIEQAAEDQIQEHIRQKFAGHRLAALVNAVLEGEGYLTRVSPPGPDGGVDILAGKGPMGFDSPRMCVQVKSSQSPADVSILRELQGILQNFQAEQGLLVCWGGFKHSVLQEARQSFFTIRLWDSGDLLKAIIRNYERFSDELQAELPLKRIWTLVLEE